MSTELGQRAEIVAAQYLQGRGYKILERNWRTRWCEIDIVVQKDAVLYFVEVKYRSRIVQGSGLDYITQRKVAQMHFAAEFWLTKHRLGGDYRLSACEVSGHDFAVTAWINDIS